jgi:hypothetical protein
LKMIPGRWFLILAALFFLPDLFAQPFGYYPEWLPGVASNDTIPIIIPSDNAEVTHTLKSGDVILGINANGGGYINYCDWGDGVNFVVPDYGKGWQFALRDFLHTGRHNPTQAGFRDPVGTRVEVIADSKRLTVPKFEMPLFCNTQFDYIQYEDLYPDQGIWDDNNNSDKDFLPETGMTQEDEVRSEFDFAVIYEDVSDSTYNNIPGFRVRSYYVWSGDPVSILQFNKDAIWEDGRAVLLEWFRVGDISHMMHGTQVPEDDDYAMVISGNFSMRFDKATFGCQYPMWRENGQWVIKNDVTEATDLLKSLDDNVDQYRNTQGKNIYSDITGKDLDLPLALYASEKSPDASKALGLYKPTGGVNAMQVVGIDRATGEIVYTEDRRIREQFKFDQRESLNYYMLAPIGRVAGLLNPRHTPHSGIIEGLYTELYVFLGTPSEILESAEMIEEYYPGLQSGYESVPVVSCRIEAENYDIGGEFISYFDSDDGNTGGAYRSDDVDIVENATASNGYMVNSIREFEWLEYTVDVPVAGLHTLAFSVSSEHDSSHMHIRDELFRLSNSFSVPKTGSADSMIVISMQNIHLKAGRQVLRLVAEKGDFNLDYLTIEKEAAASVLSRDQDPLVIYPNPFRDEFTLCTDADGYLLRVIDFHGRTRLETILKQEGLHTLGEELPPGLYLVYLIGKTGCFSRTLMKAR